MIGDTAHLSAAVFDRHDSAMDDAAVFWSSGDTNVAEFSAEGVVSARGSGTTNIAAGPAPPWPGRA
jgi:hypothetical protein